MMAVRTWSQVLGVYLWVLVPESEAQYSIHRRVPLETGEGVKEWMIAE
jgi:hypothetical protein